MDLRPGLDLLRPYSTDEARPAVLLDSNENPFNLPADVQAEVLKRLSTTNFNRYPDTGMVSLRGKIAEAEGLPVSGITVGNGSSELLAALCQTFGGKGRSIVYPFPSFSMYSIYARLADSEPVPVALNEDYTVSPAAILVEAKRTRAKLIILCNPNNPTGTVMPLQDIEAVAAGAACPVVVDEAYYEFYGQSAVGLLKKYSHLIVVRTFSKAYGLAAARIGYMLAGEEITAAVGKVLLPYHVNALSLAAAETVYDCRAKVLLGLEKIKTERSRLIEKLRAIKGITVYPSAANFIFVRLEGAGRVKACFEDRGIGVRGFGAPELAKSLRITVGSKQENEALLEALRDCMLQRKG